MHGIALHRLNISQHTQSPIMPCSLFSRLEERSKVAEKPQDRTDLKRLNRQLKEVHEELQGYNAITERIQQSPENDWEGLVALGRASFSTGFFEHVENLIRAFHDEPEKRDGAHSTPSQPSLKTVKVGKLHTRWPAA